MRVYWRALSATDFQHNGHFMALRPSPRASSLQARVMLTRLLCFNSVVTRSHRSVTRLFALRLNR